MRPSNQRFGVAMPAIILRATTSDQVRAFNDILFRIVNSINQHSDGLYSLAHEPEIIYPYRWTVMSQYGTYFEFRLDESNFRHFELEMHIPVHIHLHCSITSAENLYNDIENSVSQLLVAFRSTPLPSPSPPPPEPARTSDETPTGPDDEWWSTLEI